MLNSAIFILSQNTVERKIYLKTSLYFLFKNFNAKYKYPVIILHEGDYDEHSKNEIKMSIRSECRKIIRFQELDSCDFIIPEHIDIEKMNKCIEVRPVPYWRNKNYRIMCYFWIKHFFKYCKEYDYVMRLDDDSIIEETINTDLFDVMEKKDLNYASNIIHIDCSICNYGMKKFFIDVCPMKKDKINELFIDHKLKDDATHFDKFKNLYQIINECNYNKNEFDMSMPIMYYNNFSITRTRIWNTPEIKNIINEIDKLGYIFYFRWGDAPLQTILMKLYDNTKLSKFSFKYSKRLQRESFQDEDNNIHSFMPYSYDNNSCVSKK
tara:strand:- start:7101 stop:8069 length:969 start_codon:yes stop_codon:yes gene_type:complete